MKCEWVKENILLYVYHELADDARYELEQHVARCADCAAELKAEQDFHALLSQDRVSDPTPNLLTSSRMHLQEALETTQQGSVWTRLAFDPANWLRQVRFSAALCGPQQLQLGRTRRFRRLAGQAIQRPAGARRAHLRAAERYQSGSAAEVSGCLGQLREERH